MWGLPFGIPWQTLGTPSTLSPIGQLHQSPPLPGPGDQEEVPVTSPTYSNIETRMDKPKSVVGDIEAFESACSDFIGPKLKKLHFLSFFLGWRRPHLITGLTDGEHPINHLGLKKQSQTGADLCLTLKKQCPRNTFDFV